jgi:hypothetical protein
MDLKQTDLGIQAVDNVSFFEIRSSDNKISFSLDNKKDEILVLEKGWFWYKGNKIEDINEAYEKFCNWLNREMNVKLL